MLILLRTQVDRTDKTPVTARRARVGSLCGFRGAAERVYQPEARRPDVAPLYGIVAGTANAEKERLQANFGRGRSRKRRSRRKGLALFCASPSTSARSAGSFGG